MSMILKREVKDLLGKEVKFLTRGMQPEGRMECAAGMLQYVDGHSATILSEGSRYSLGFEDIFTMDEDIPAILSEKELKDLDKRNIQKYMSEMTDMADLLRFPLIYDVQKSAPAWEAINAAQRKLLAWIFRYYSGGMIFMILKREAKNLLGKKVKFLIRGLYGPDTFSCFTGTLQNVKNNAAVIVYRGCHHWAELDDIFTIEDKIPDLVGPEEKKSIDEIVIRKYAEEMTNMKSLFEFPLLYNLRNDKPREAYKRRVKELAGIDIQ